MFNEVICSNYIGDMFKRGDSSNEWMFDEACCLV